MSSNMQRKFRTRFWSLERYNISNNNYELDKKLDWILLCNDSNFCLGGKNSNSS